MRWTRCNSVTPPSPRYGHSAVAVDARDVWGTELVIVYGGSCKQDSGRRALGDVVVFQVSVLIWCLYTQDEKKCEGTSAPERRVCLVIVLLEPLSKEGLLTAVGEL